MSIVKDVRCHGHVEQSSGMDGCTHSLVVGTDRTSFGVRARLPSLILLLSFHFPSHSFHHLILSNFASSFPLFEPCLRSDLNFQICNCAIGECDQKASTSSFSSLARNRSSSKNTQPSKPRAYGTVPRTKFESICAQTATNPLRTAPCTA